MILAEQIRAGKALTDPIPPGVIREGLLARLRSGKFGL